MNFGITNSFPSKAPRGFLGVVSCFFLAIAVAVGVAEPSPQDDENADPSAPRFLSPDGRYGLLVRADPEGGERVELIEVATKRSLVVLSDPERPEISSKARLDWSKDSKMVAAYTATRVDGFTDIYGREGDGFVKVKLPKLPELPNPEEPSVEFRKKHKFKFLKWIDTGTLEFVRWLEPGVVELRYSNEVATAGGGSFSAEINATVAIDSKHHDATLKKVTRKESSE
jgi:hypothetical protein